jgi:serine phosphatase RsbU (regulator of sigma subunit)
MKICSFYLRLLILTFIVILFLQHIFAQKKQLPENVASQINNYEMLAIKNMNSGNENTAASYYNKIAYLYWDYFIFDKAVSNFEKVLTINHNLNNHVGELKVLENIAFLYSDLERYDKTIEYLQRSLYISKNIGNKNQIANDLINLGIAYNNNGLYDKAIKTAKEALLISKELNNEKLIRSCYGILHEAYNKIENKEAAMKYFELYSTIDKHIQRKAYKQQETLNKQKIKEAEIQKDIALKQKEETEEDLLKTKDTLEQNKLVVDLLNAENEAKEAKIKAKEAELKAEQRLRYSIMIALVFICIVAFLIYVQMQQKKKANKILQDLNKEIEKKNKQILDSINYASHIQEAILPYEKKIKANLPDSFVLYKPRDIVSGDFYWHSNHNDMVFIAAIDCTGHGVPGAFMSMIGNTLLNEIVNEKQVFEPAKVLHLLNEKVAFTLNQGNKQNFSEDGMDITFCCYDKKNKKLQMALANHSAIIIKDKKTYSVEGDIYSVGGNTGFSEVSFTNHSFDIDADTTLYMYSDGFQDQFGGDNNQKYMVTRFVNFITKIQEKPFNEHKKLFINEYNNWKGSSKQIDDILIIGIKFT